MMKTVSIKRNYEFMRAYKKGKFFVGKFITLYIIKNNSSSNRLGITVGKKIGKSVTRNRIKRLIRENYRLLEVYTADGYDYVFVSRSSEKMPDFFDIKKEMKFLLKRLNVFDREKWDCLKGC